MLNFLLWHEGFLRGDENFEKIFNHNIDYRDCSSWYDDIYSAK